MNSQESEIEQPVKAKNVKKQKICIDMDQVNNFQEKVPSYLIRSTISSNSKGPNGI